MMRGNLRKILEGVAWIVKGMLKELRKATLGVMIASATDMLKLEHDELEAAFLTVLLGSLAGMLLATPGLALEVAPLVKDELAIMIERHAFMHDALAEYAGMSG